MTSVGPVGKHSASELVCAKVPLLPAARVVLPTGLLPVIGTVVPPFLLMKCMKLARTQRKQTSYVSSDKTKSTSSSTKSSSNEAQHLRYQGFRSDYALGEVVRSPADMVIETSTKAAIRSVSSLQMHDFAWVRRSDGSFTYAILAYRTDDKLTFLTCDASSTKSISRKYWGTHIRRVCVEQTTCREIVSNYDTSSSENDDVPRGFDVDQYWMELMGKKETVPLSIPFDDDSSVISDVSMPRW